MRGVKGGWQVKQTVRHGGEFGTSNAVGFDPGGLRLFVGNAAFCFHGHLAQQDEGRQYCYCRPTLQVRVAPPATDLG